MNTGTVWLGLGFLAQGMFTLRFFIQWIVSERRKESHVPHPHPFDYAQGWLLPQREKGSR
ncbi:MAG: lipid-A-disaccharide synthase N-terminal domain-containing protein [Elusimicrobia bacterium]|nr:lipid-A-disaccharide synthase N-terminal domain-containing protein [Elusimicrobiota bacterium]